MDEMLWTMIPFRKCFFSKNCKRLAEFKVTSEPMLYPHGGSIGLAVSIVHLCPFHTRLQLKTAHDIGQDLQIEKLS
jgi:hypothetical protein